MIRRPVHDHAADLHDVAAIGYLQRDIRVLLDEQDRQALLLVEALDDAENLLHEHRRQAERFEHAALMLIGNGEPGTRDVVEIRTRFPPQGDETFDGLIEALPIERLHVVDQQEAGLTAEARAFRDTCEPGHQRRFP